MENVPPSYDAAVARNPWSIIAPFIPSTELCALNQVCKEFQNVFAPYLWGNPASHFGTENDRVHVALACFMRTLKGVRLSVRKLTHTLHLPPAPSEIYEGPHPEWLRDVLEQLPNLQSLIVSRLACFDHLALLALRNCSDGRRPLSEGGGVPSIFALRLLIARNCPNTTPQGLVEALNHFPNLAFLDLSRTSAARDRSVLAMLGNLPSLQVLKLRDVHLRDEDVVSLADAIGKRVRSLDVSNNDLTDLSIRTLLSSCFGSVGETPSDLSGTAHRTALNMPVEDWPLGFVRPDPALLDEFRDESYDERLVRRLTSKIVSRLPFEDLPQSGITHLFISGNHFSVDGLAELIESKKLHVLDAGSVNTTEGVDRPKSNSSNPPNQVNGDHLNLPGVEKLSPILARCGQEMTSLRIHHSIVTSTAPPTIEHSHLADCEHDTEEHQYPPEVEVGVPRIAEFGDIAPPMYELDRREVAPAYEAPAVASDLVSPVPRQNPPSGLEQQQAESLRGSVHSREVANRQNDKRDGDDEGQPVITAPGLDSMPQAMNGADNSVLSAAQINTADPASPADSNPSLSHALIQKQRRIIRNEQMSRPQGLLPGMVPNLRTLVLTDVPCHENKPKVVDALISFLRYCSSETKRAADGSRLEPHRLRKPGLSRPQQQYHHHQNARESFALQRIVLEMAPAEPLSATGMLSTPSTSKSKHPNRTKSSTEDADSEAMWTASENDFTFFADEEEEERGSPTAAPTISLHAPLPALPLPFPLPETMKMQMKRVSADTASSLSRRPSPSSSSSTLQHLKHPAPHGGEKEEEEEEEEEEKVQAPLIDIVKELAAFRKERKAAFDDEVAAAAAAARDAGGGGCGGGGYVDGYWPGEVKVVRVVRGA